MYYRRKTVLSLLEVFDNELEKILLQKLLLFTQKQDNPAYDFMPYKFGCFSFHANSDLIKTNESLATLLNSGPNAINNGLLLRSDMHFF